jgi:hypothetical protein
MNSDHRTIPVRYWRALRVVSKLRYLQNEYATWPHPRLPPPPLRRRRRPPRPTNKIRPYHIQGTLEEAYPEASSPGERNPSGRYVQPLSIFVT